MINTRSVWHSMIAAINVCMWTIFYFQFTNDMAPKSMATFNPCDIRNKQCTLTICQNQPISHCAWHHQHKYSHFVDNFTLTSLSFFFLSSFLLFCPAHSTFRFMFICAANNNIFLYWNWLGFDTCMWVCVCVRAYSYSMYANISTWCSNAHIVLYV